MRDLKYSYSVKADEIAYERYGMDFYDLTDDQQMEVWGEAEQEVIDDQISDAENILDEMRMTMTEEEIEDLLKVGN